MGEHQRIEVAKEADRDALALILYRNGYTVRYVKEKSMKGNNTYVHYIEYWRGGGE